VNIEELYTKCQLCPRACSVNRHEGMMGYCHETDTLVVGRAALHFWEEPCLSGSRGSGAIFFAGCNMGCVFCQNHDLSKGKVGEKITLERLIEIFFELKEQGAHNINLVTPTHYVPHLVMAIEHAKKEGLDLPIIYNCSGYESVAALRTLEGLIDIYLPDFKYNDEALAVKYSKAKEYPRRVKEAIAEMVRQVGSPVFDEEGMMQKGVIVRHLLLPGQLIDSKSIVKYLYETYEDKIFMSLMNQYTPLPHVKNFPELDRRVSQKSYDRLIDFALDLGLENAFIQEGETAKDSFIPAFNGEGVSKEERKDNGEEIL